MSIGKYLRSWGTPLSFLILLVLSFGLMIPWLGFYWDAWPIVLATRLQGVSAFWEYYGSERPFNPLTVIPAASLLGTVPLNWHLFALFMRWLSVLGFYWSLRGIWPNQVRQAVWIAMLFAIYPIFTQQPVAATFTTHWLVYAAFFYSLGAMIYAVRSPRWRIPLTLTGMAAQLYHMLPLEYFWGLELLRPFALWIVLSESHPHWRDRLLAVLKAWAPYLIIYAGVLTWWLGFRENLPESNQPDALLSLSATPLQAGLHFLQVILQDLIHNLFGAWYLTIEPVGLDLNDRSVLASLGLALVTAVFIFAFLRRQSQQEAGGNEDEGWALQAIFIGLLGTFLGSVPIWAIDRQSLFGLQSGRFALASMTGMSMLFVGLLEWFTPRRLPKALTLAVLIGLAAGFHLRVSTAYYRSTLLQNQFYWQLYWRAPYLEPRTAILSKDELFIYVGRKPTAVTLNLLYPQPFGTKQVGYWFLEMDHDVGSKVVPKLARGRAFDVSFRTFDFSGSSLDSLVIFYKPGAGRCLWVLSPEDADNPQLPDLTRLAVPVSNLSRIQPQPISEDYPPVELFGREPERSWCYYYQKASLSVQFQEWQEAARLGDQAEQNGYAPNNSYEWLPFIQAYAMNGRWETALQRTDRAFAADETLAPRLCRLWDQMTAGSIPPEDWTESIQSMKNKIKCMLYQNPANTATTTEINSFSANNNVIP